MFSNRQDNSSNLLHQTISTSGSIGLPPTPPIVSIASIASNSNNNLTVTSVSTTILALDGLNCGGIPTPTTPTLTPTTLRNIAADIASLTPGTSEDFAAAAASDLHHLVSPSCITLNMSSGPSDRLSSDLQDRHSLQNLGIQHLNPQTLNNHLNLNDLQNQQNLNQNGLNQQQQNDYNNSFSSSASRQAGFVPPLVLQINSNSNNISQSGISNNSSGSTSIFSAKGPTTSVSSSHWQGAVVTQRPHSQTNMRIKQRFTDDEDFDEDNDSLADYGTDSSDTMSGKLTQKQNTKNNSKIKIKSESKNTSNSGRRTNKDNKIMSVEEEHRRQIRRERNKLAAARCRKRRMDHTNELVAETEQLEGKRLSLQVKIQDLRQQKTNLQDMLARHKCAMNNGSVSNSISTVNHTTTVLDSNDISESSTVLSSDLSIAKRNPLQQQNISINVNNDSNINNSGVSIKCEDHTVIQSSIDNKDNMDIIPSTVLQQPQRRRPTTLLEPINDNFYRIKKISGNGSTGAVVLNFESLMDGGTGLTPVSTKSSSTNST